MHIYSVYDKEFARYGRLLNGYDCSELIRIMKTIPLPESGTDYEASLPALEACSVFRELQDAAYGGLPIELGMCWGRNRKMNCLEYHRTSELNLGAHDFILLVALECEIVDGQLDTECAKAFHVPAGVLVEVYATTLHYAPCHADGETGFRTAVVLPRGTNMPLEERARTDPESKMLAACNKWLLAHPDSAEAGTGCYVGLAGRNIEI